VRATVGWVAQEPPRSTRYVWPKKTSLYSRYGKLTNPGYGRNQESVHSQTSPMSCSTPYGLAPSGNAPTGAGRAAR